MATFLANENVPGEVVETARQSGYDLAWIAESSPGADDDAVLAAALATRYPQQEERAQKIRLLNQREQLEEAGRQQRLF